MIVIYISIGILFLIMLSFGIYAISQIISTIFGAPYYKTPNKAICKALKSISLKENDIFYDFGCGSGRVIKYAADNFNIEARGIEISPLQYLKAKILTIDNKNIDVKLCDFSKINLADADVVFCYLMPKIMFDLEKKFAKELKRGAYLISCNFKLKNKKPTKVINCDDSKIYIYSF